MEGVPEEGRVAPPMGKQAESHSALEVAECDDVDAVGNDAWAAECLVDVVESVDELMDVVSSFAWSRLVGALRTSGSSPTKRVVMATFILPMGKISTVPFGVWKGNVRTGD